MEWLYHMGVPEEEIPALAEHSANTIPCMMPYITAFFMPRGAGDRPAVVPEGAVNFAFIGQFCRDAPGYHLYDRVFRAYRHGGGLHTVEH